MSAKPQTARTSLVHHTRALAQRCVDGCATAQCAGGSAVGWCAMLPRSVISVTSERTLKMGWGRKNKNPNTTRRGESRELQLLLFNFLCNVICQTCAVQVGRQSKTHLPRPSRALVCHRTLRHRARLCGRGKQSRGPVGCNLTSSWPSCTTEIPTRRHRAPSARRCQASE